MAELTYWVANWNLSRQEAIARLGGPTDDMADLIGSEAPRDLPDLEHTSIRKVGVYVTGTGGVQWPLGMIREYLLNGFSVVTIDQRDGPAVTADVADVEGGAKTPAQAIIEAEDMLSRGDDYTVYISEANLAGFEQAWARTGHPAGRIVAYQYASPSSNPNTELSPGVTLKDANVDLSVTLQSWYPTPAHRPPPPPPPHLKRAVVTYDRDTDGWAVRPGVTGQQPPGYHSTVTIDLAAGPGWSIKPGVG